MSTAIAIREAGQPVSAVEMGELSVDQVLAQVEKIQTLMQKGMKVDEHYGKIPGTDKPTLLKAGAEKLCFMFRLSPEYSIEEIQLPGGHVKIVSTCRLTHIPTGAFMGAGMGSCSTRESKYAYRKAERVCPTCGKEAIIKGAAQFGGGWLCWKKKDGCGAKFKDADPAIVSQEVGRKDNPDLADTENTVLKMSNKRALVAAVLNVTAASDIFTQDMEDIATAREELRAETAKAEGASSSESSAQQGDAGSGNGGQRRLRMKKDDPKTGGEASSADGSASPTASGPTPPPGDSIVMVDEKRADELFARANTSPNRVPNILKSIALQRKGKGDSTAPASFKDLSLEEANWVDKVLKAAENR